jgi:citrate lyase subunit beta/citryl-CoA lyase
MTSATLPVWRSLLFVPVTAKRFVDGAARRGADAIILDLEDSVAASEKGRARTLVPEAAEIVSRGGADVVVRVNRPWRQCLRDIEAVVGPRVLALALPKVDSAEHVRMVAEVVDELEVERGMASGSTRLIAMVETAAAFFHIAEIACGYAPSTISPPRPVSRQTPRHCRCRSRWRCSPPEPPASCRWASIGSIAEFHDLDGFRSTIRRSHRFGFIGASVIHPRQVPILNEEFRPSTEEVDHARRVVAAYDQALSEGVGAVTVGGKMIDVPVVERARLLLEREAAIAIREATMARADS